MNQPNTAAVLLALIPEYWPRSRLTQTQLGLLAEQVGRMRMEPAQVTAVLRNHAAHHPRAEVPAIIAALRAAASPVATKEFTPAKQLEAATYEQLREPLPPEIHAEILAHGEPAISAALPKEHHADQRDMLRRVADLSGFGAALLLRKLETPQPETPHDESPAAIPF